MVRKIFNSLFRCILCLHSAFIAWGTPSGGLDTGFNGTGIVDNAFPRMCINVNDIEIQNDGKILVAGYDFSKGDQDYFIARFQADGRLDVPFGLRSDRPGYVVDSDRYFDEFNELAVQNDGKILAVGSTADKNKISRDLVLYRYKDDGTADFSFGLMGEARYAKKS